MYVVCTYVHEVICIDDDRLEGSCCETVKKVPSFRSVMQRCTLPTLFIELTKKEYNFSCTVIC